MGNDHSKVGLLLLCVFWGVSRHNMKELISNDNFITLATGVSSTVVVKGETSCSLSSYHFEITILIYTARGQGEGIKHGKILMKKHQNKHLCPYKSCLFMQATFFLSCKPV